MTEKQALILLNDVELHLRSGAADLHQIGNGEWVVIIKKRSVFLWNRADWKAYQSQPQKQPARRAGTPAQEEAAV